MHGWAVREKGNSPSAGSQVRCQEQKEQPREREGVLRANLEGQEGKEQWEAWAGQVLRRIGLQIRGTRVQKMGRAVRSGSCKLNVEEIK